MQLLKEKILSEGQALSEDILKVDSFLNHQMDPMLMKEIGKEFVKRFEQKEITKVLTIESSGIGPGLMAALELEVPLIFARKRKSLTLTNDLVTASVHSFTKKETNTITVSNKYIEAGDKVLIIDDFLAVGQAARGLVDICNQVGAEVAGIGIVIEKAFQSGGKDLREQGFQVESLARIAELKFGEITFAEEMEGQPSMSNQSPLKVASLGLQHVLAMYAGAIVVPLIVGGALGLTAAQLTYLVSIDILMCGIATLLQVWKNKFFGIGLPVVLGCTFTAVSPMIAVGTQYGISTIYGAILVSGLIVIIISKFFGKLARFFPPVVTGSVVMIIGITLIPVAINNLGGGQGAPDFGNLDNVALGFGTLLFIIFMYKFSTGFVRSISILLGLLVGTFVAFFLGKVDFSSVASATWLHLPHFFYFGTPTFNITAIITMTLVAIVSLVESTGVYYALGEITDKEISEDDLARGYRSEGLAIMLGGLFNAFPYTAFSQNVGLIQLSGIKTRNVIYTTAGMLIFIGFVPKIGAFTTIIPSSVLGGAMVAMFGMVIAAGIKMLSKVDFASQENLLIIACSVGMGLGVTVVPELFAKIPESIQILTDNGIVAGSLTAIFLNIVFNIVPTKGKVKEARIERQNVA